jgi:hypothetical protein
MSSLGWWNVKCLAALAILGGVAASWIVVTEVSASREIPAPTFQDLLAPKGIDLNDPRFGQPQGRAVVGEVEHYFGEMDVGQTGRHVFTVRNEGKGRLHFESGKTSCHCTSLRHEQTSIGPGQEGRFVLEWKTTRPTETFRHGGWIITDDPAMLKIRFTVVGSVRARLGARPEVATFGNIAADESATARVALYSQAWDDLDIEKIECDHPGVTWNLAPLDAEKLESVEAKSGRELTISAAPGLPRGAFSAIVRVHARPVGDPGSELVVREIPVQGRVVDDVTLHGTELRQGVLDLRMIKSGSARASKLHLLARGESRELNLGRIEVEPSFLRVKVTRLPSGANLNVAHYEIDVEVPADAPLCDYLGGTALGRVRIATDHPQKPEISFDVGFAVVPSEEQRILSRASDVAGRTRPARGGTAQENQP